jgi:hypothetical protein
VICRHIDKPGEEQLCGRQDHENVVSPLLPDGARRGERRDHDLPVPLRDRRDGFRVRRSVRAHHGIDAVLHDQLLVECDGRIGIGCVIVDQELHTTPEQAAAPVDIARAEKVAVTGGYPLRGQWPGLRHRCADADGFGGDTARCQRPGEEQNC